MGIGIGFRIFLIDEADKIIRVPATRFDRLRDRDPKESLPQYKNSRIRYAMVILELENRKPISIVRIDYGYLAFDSEGRVDQKFLDAEGLTAVSMIPSIAFHGEPAGVVHAGHKFAEKRFKHEFTWSPSSELEQSIIHKAFG
jgi:hypothetical protein